MNKLTLLLVLGLLSTFILSCTREKITCIGEEQDKLSLEIRKQHQDTTLFGDITNNQILSITTRNQTGRSLPNIELTLRSRTDGVSFVEPVISTDQYGVAIAQMEVQLPAGNHLIGYSIRCRDSLYHFTEQIKVFPTPHSIEAPTRVREFVDNAGLQRIEIPISVLDEDLIGVPQVPVNVRMRNVGDEANVLGSLAIPGKTDEEGQMVITFIPNGQEGEVVLITGTDLDGLDSLSVTTILVLVASSPNGYVFIEADHDTLHPYKEYNRTAQIDLTLLGADLKPQANQKINFSSSFGSVPSLSITDFEGKVSVPFTIESDELGTAQILATCNQLQISDSVSIEIRDIREIQDQYLIVKSRYEDVIYKRDDKQNYELVISLTDIESNPIPGKDVYFSCTKGYIDSVVITDSLGLARAAFYESSLEFPREVGDFDTSMVYIECREFGLIDSFRIEYSEYPYVDEISVRIQANRLTAGSGDSTAVRAVCRLHDSSPAPSGTIVHFDAKHGSFSNPTIAVSGSAGAASNYYYAGHTVSEDTIRAYVVSGDTIIWSNEEYIDLVSGPPALLQLEAVPPEVDLASELDTIVVLAEITDTRGNPVRAGTFVSFSAGQDQYVHPSSITDDDGIAQTVYTVPDSVGTYTVTASLNYHGNVIEREISIRVFDHRPVAIDIHAQPNEVYDFQTTHITATVINPMGNPVSAGYPVLLRLNPEYHPEPERLAYTDPSGTVNYEVLFFNPPRTVTMNLTVWRDSTNNPDDTVHTVFDDFTVLGRPGSIELSIEHNGRYIGAGAWEVGASALVRDQFDNLMRAGVPVVFSVNPQIASIPTAYTDDHGFAHTTLVYSSENSLTPVTIFAEVSTGFVNAWDSLEFVLPLQQGRLLLTVSPGNHHFEEDNDEDEAIIRLQATLNDGYGNLINDAPIVFSSTRGSFSWLQYPNDQWVAFGDEPAIAVTGLRDREHNEQSGRATVYLKSTSDEFFLNQESNEETVIISAEVYEMEIEAEPRVITVTR